MVEEIVAAGGVAVANGDDVSEWDGAQRLIQQAIDVFGRLDVLVNNAGILRDRTIANMSIEEWDAVIKVHLRGTFAPLRHAAAYWRDRSKTGEVLDGRVINTSSGSGLYGNPGQGNYGAAKAGIANLTIIAAQELARYGVKVNAIAPSALTRMTENTPFVRKAQELRDSGSAEFNPFDPDNVASLVVWLAGATAAEVTGRVFNIGGGTVGVAEPWDRGPERAMTARWKLSDFDDAMPAMLSGARVGVDVTPEA